jgi:hydrogenase maturation protease
MTDGSAEILVLGLGNLLLSDDGVGLRLLEELKHEAPEVEFVDGGTQGLALLAYLANRRAVIVLDAVALGAMPGSIHVLQGDAIAAHRAESAHGSNALELLATARLLGDLPSWVTIVGIEPASIATGIGLSPAVEAAVPDAAARARAVLALALQELANVPCNPR